MDPTPPNKRARTAAAAAPLPEQPITSTSITTTNPATKRPPAPRSPRSQEIRERNREAVRKCRERKRAEAVTLKERMELVKKENASLRTMLELGAESTTKQAKGKEMVSTIVNMLDHNDDHLVSTVQSFIEGYVETGSDKTAQLSFLVGRIHRLLAPEPVSLRYLSMISSEDDDDALWREFRSVVNLTPEQETKLRSRKITGKRTMVETKYVLETFRAIAAEMNQRKVVSEEFHKLPTEVLNCKQFAHFLAWVHRDPFSTDLLDAAWTQMQTKLDMENAMLALSREGNTSMTEVKRLLDLVRLENGNLMKKLFMETDPKEKERLAQRVFENDVVIIDPPNGGEFRGMTAALKYVGKIQKSFTNLETGEMSLVMTQKFDPKSPPTMDGDRALTKWILSGMYSGKLLQGVAGTTTPSPREPQPTLQRHVNTEVVISATFVKDGDRMKELVISTDLVGLLRTLNSAAAAESAGGQGLTSTDRALLQGIRTLFENGAGDVDQVHRLLSPRCVFEDSNMSCESKGLEECVAYVERLRSAFPTLIVKTHTDSVMEDGTLRSMWGVEAAYGGVLARSTDHTKPCSLRVVMFVKTDENDAGRAARVRMSWDAASLFKQLGLQ